MTNFFKILTFSLFAFGLFSCTKDQLDIGDIDAHLPATKTQIANATILKSSPWFTESASANEEVFKDLKLTFEAEAHNKGGALKAENMEEGIFGDSWLFDKESAVDLLLKGDFSTAKISEIAEESLTLTFEYGGKETTLVMNHEGGEETPDEDEATEEQIEVATNIAHKWQVNRIVDGDMALKDLVFTFTADENSLGGTITVEGDDFNGLMADKWEFDGDSHSTIIVGGTIEEMNIIEAEDGTLSVDFTNGNDAYEMEFKHWVEKMDSDLYVTADGAGLMNGEDFDNALAANKENGLQEAYDMLPAGFTLYIGGGNYDVVQHLEILEGNKNIVGVDNGDGFPVFVGPRSFGGESEDVFIQLEASDVTISFLNIKKYYRAIKMGDEGSKYMNTTLRGLHFEEVFQAIFLTDVTGLSMDEITVVSHGKNGIRIEDASDINLDRVSVTGSKAAFDLEDDSQEGLKFVNCSNVVMTEITSTHNHHERSGDWNGHGIDIDENCANVSITGAILSDNTGQGLNIAAAGASLENIVSIRNRENFSIKGYGTTNMVNCASLYAKNHRGEGQLYGVRVGQGRGAQPIIVNMTNCTLYNSGDYWGSEARIEQQSTVTMTDCIIAKNIGSRVMTDTKQDAEFIFDGTILSNANNAEDGSDAVPNFNNDDAEWNGQGDAFNSQVYPTKGFRQN
ncbi:right-handed parallel beta-helix repeat-containing protein [Persicobacter psychrovividus]|uniref:Right handed beta helix domain-containing protein n=1 Tax=Persicobacter psychrovividus TaxID=387638 RepID=A0ABM7VIM0_9BACT|nr:hypothetical protein PEPS_31010 [Persicobacter psychrovividus]